MKCNSMGLRFNVSKCVALIIGKTIGFVVKNLVLYDDLYPWSKEKCYLGFTCSSVVLNVFIVEVCLMF